VLRWPNESDTTKLSSLVQELIEALDKGKRGWRRTVRPPDAIETNRESFLQSKSEAILPFSSGDSPSPPTGQQPKLAVSHLLFKVHSGGFYG